MEHFNLCDAFFSGYYFFREEFASCALGYVLSPFSSGKISILADFLDLLIGRTEKYRDLLAEAKEKLKNPASVTWEKSFVNNPLESSCSIASALEYNQIDVLIKIDDILLIFENKIYDASVGRIDKQLAAYQKELPAQWQKRTVPVAIFPQKITIDTEDIIALSWLGENDFTLLEFFQSLAVEYQVLNEFTELIRNKFIAGCRAPEIQRKNYDELINEFEGDYPQIIGKMFPEENFAPGDDMNTGGCLLYCLKLRKSDQECFPFRLLVNGKCEILYQGLRKDLFLYGHTFDGQHTVRDIIRQFLLNRGFRFDRYHFSYKEFREEAKQQAFGDVIDLLRQMDDEMWGKDKFNECYLELTKSQISGQQLRDGLNDCLALPTEKLLKNKQLLHELYRAINAVISEK